MNQISKIFMLGFSVVMVLLYSVSASSQDIIRYNNPAFYSDEKQDYYLGLLKLTLEASKDKYGDYQLIAKHIVMLQKRTSMVLAESPELDVSWVMTSKLMEEHLSAVYIPLIKGLIGYRVFIINADQQAEFSKNMTLAQLQAKTAGQGYDWPDTKILKQNDFKVISGKDNNLLTMLSFKHIDYFPRAIYEPWVEIKDKPEFIVESHFLLHYPTAMYFFVKKSNHRLQQRLTYGLNKLIENGGFDRYFYQQPLINHTLEHADFAGRKLIHLDNPLLTPETRRIIENKKLWFQVPAK